MTAKPLLAAVETGGTKCIVSVGRDPDTARRHRIETRSPTETANAIEMAVCEEIGHNKLDAVGIASFGPLDINLESPTYGRIGRTPKPHWEGFNLRSHLAKRFNCPVMSESDVNGAALAEAHWQLDNPIQHLAYVTVGTGIGVGILQSGKIANGLSHPEVGHIRVEKHTYHRAFAGACSIHGDCLEGLASGTAIEAQWGSSLSELGENHVALTLEAFYLSQLTTNLFLHHRPEVIIFGGGVSQTPTLLQKIRAECLTRLGDYLPELASTEAMQKRISAARLGSDAGILGAFMLAQHAFFASDSV
jgi:fructokinase